MFSMTDDMGEREPSVADLAAIEAEWPQIERDMADLDAEIQALAGAGRADDLAVRRTRRAGRRVLRPVRGSLGGEAA